jgi:hypothetical protein
MYFKLYKNTLVYIHWPSPIPAPKKVTQADLELSILLPQPLSAGITGMYNHALLVN